MNAISTLLKFICEAALSHHLAKRLCWYCSVAAGVCVEVSSRRIEKDMNKGERRGRGREGRGGGGEKRKHRIVPFNVIMADVFHTVLSIFR